MRVAAYYTLTWMEQESREIARGLRGRDPDLLARLIEQYHYRLLRYLIHLTGDPSTAEDLFQETWIRVLERGSQYNGRDNFAAWLIRIARNLTIDYLRQRRLASLDQLMENDEDAPAMQFAVADSSPLQNALAHETSEHVAAALAQIPVVFREVLVLRFQEEMKLEEIAVVVGIPLSTVKSRLYRGVMALRPRLSEARNA
jgi:RNA polymerase sigma-70 factor, ECF subfamily